MSCCNASINIGCFDYCSEIATGFSASQNGEHIILVYVVNSTVQAIPVTLAIGEEIIIPPSILNEAKTQEIQVQQPDGELLEFEPGVFCLRLKTEIVTVSTV